MRIRNDLVDGIPNYSFDADGSDAPAMFYGRGAPDTSLAAFANVPALSTYHDILNNVTYRKGLDALWSKLLTAANTVYTVGPGCDFATLSAAMNAITDASASKTYLLVVTGKITETTTINGKSYVSVLFLPDASVTNSQSSGHTVILSSVSNAIWAAVDASNPHIIRSGAVSSAAYGLYASGCASTLTLYNLCVSNTTTGAGSCYGIYNYSSSPTMTNCTGIGGNGGTSCHGIVNTSGSSPTMTNCTGIGGNGGTFCYGIYNTSGSSPTMMNCTGIGGNGTGCYGIYNSGSSPTMMNCTGIGGNGGTSCHGIYNASGSSPTMMNCTGIGGNGGTSCHGIYNASGSSPTMMNCTGIGGNGGTSCYGIVNASGSSPTMTNCTGIGGGAKPINTSASIPASTRQEDGISPGTGFLYRITGIAVNVTAAAAAGVTLTFRTGSGGSGYALTGAIDVSSTGWKHFPITGWYVISSGNSFYGYLSASDSTLAYTIYYTYTIENGTCYALYLDSNTRNYICNSVFISNGSSPAIYVTSNGDDQAMFVSGVASSGMNSATRQKAFVCAVSWNPGQVYNMVLDGGSTNLTAATGTMNGSNVEV